MPLMVFHQQPNRYMISGTNSGHSYMWLHVEIAFLQNASWIAVKGEICKKLVVC